jgi:hypothetical protein
VRRRDGGIKNRTMKKLIRNVLDRLPKRGHVLKKAEDPRVRAAEGVEGLESHPDELPHLSSVVSLSIIFFLALAFVAWGFLVYSTVGSKWPPPWNFGEVQDLPGASTYSTETGKRFLGAGPRRLQTVPPQPQHVEEKPKLRPLRDPNG